MFGNVGLTALAYFQSTDQVSDKLCVPETYPSMAPGFNQTNIRQYFMTQIKNTQTALFYWRARELYVINLRHRTGNKSRCNSPGVALGPKEKYI